MTTRKHLLTTLATLLSLLIAGCMEPNQVVDAEEENPPLEPHPWHGSEPEPEPEPQPNQEPEPGSKPEPEMEPEPELKCDNKPPTNTMQFDVAPEVSEKDQILIRCGLARSQEFFDRELGGGISDEVLAEALVKVVATGKGDPHPDGGGSCCTMVPGTESGDIRIFFDTAHRHWVNPWDGWPAEPQRETSVIHESAHGWQSSLGCITKYSKPLGFWMNEGIANQVSYAAMIERGIFEKDDVLAFMESAAKSGNGEQWYTPLRQLESNEMGVWPGHIGYLALEFAMNMEGATHGLMSVRVICEEVANGATLQEAFQTTFGTSMDSFYTQFEAWKAENTV